MQIMEKMLTSVDISCKEMEAKKGKNEVYCCPFRALIILEKFTPGIEMPGY